MRIALMVVLAFAALWFAALRPKPPASEPVATPAPAPRTAAGVTSAPKKAEGAVAQANGSAAAKEAAAADGTAQAAKAKPAKPAAERAAAADTAAKSAPAGAEPAADDTPVRLQRVLDDLEAKRTTVLLFWDRRVSDDREVRRAVGDIDRHGGKVRIHVQPIAKVGLFEPVTRNIPVATSPTVLIIGKDRRARAVQGLTVTRELDELVVKALDGR
jgi:hypothetical protein